MPVLIVKKNLMRIKICGLIVAFAALMSAKGFSQKTVYAVQLNDDTINPVTADYIQKAIERAEREAAECLIIKLDTPGGLLNSTRLIVKNIMAAQIPIVVHIAPSGSRAGSAGVFITYAAHVAAMAPSTNIGAAHPVQMGQKNKETNIWDAVKEIVRKVPGQTSEKNTDPVTEDTTDEKNDPMESKILNDTVAFIKSLAEKRGRNVEWAVQSVVQSDSITEHEALEKGVIDFIAQSDPDLLAQLDGRALRVGEQDKVLHTAGATIHYIEMDTRQKLFNILANPNIAYILLMLGFYGLLYEVTNPGIGVPGIAGAIFLILAFFSMQTLPTNYAGLALLILGLSLFVAEAMVPGFGLLSFGGLVALILGSLLLFDSDVAVMRVSLSIVLPMALATAGLTIFLVKSVISAHRKKSISGQEGLIGSKGVARSIINPEKSGRVFVHGEIWTAVSADDIQPGDPVIIETMEGLTLSVRKF